MFVSIIFSALFGLFLWKVFFPVPRPILGIYSRAGNRGILKQVFMFLLMKLRKRSKKNTEVGYGVKLTNDIKRLESVQDLGTSPLAIDAVLFTGGSRDGTYLIISAARRAEKIVQCIVMLFIPGLGLLEHSQHPDTSLLQGEEEAGWVAEGVHLEPVEPMKKWKVKFAGEMMMKNEGSIITSHKVVIDAEYNSELEYFDFDSDMDPWTVSRAMAREPWSREYFNRLKAAHQSHYEQFGEVSGVTIVDGQERALRVSVMRDHTHGSNRDWKLMHRYCLHNFTCQDGTRGFLGVVSQPGTFSYLELGYIYDKKGQKQPVQEVDFPIWNFGEGGQDPDDYGFRFRAGDQWYQLQVEVIRRGQIFFGSDWEARVIERMCRYKLNGLEGWGVSEWEYRHTEGKQ